MDAWVFEIIPAAETCAGWDHEKMEELSRKSAGVWARYDNDPAICQTSCTCVM